MKELVKRLVEIAYETKNKHLASGLSALPIINGIYSKMEEGDIFILSKGHGNLGLYPVLEKYGKSPNMNKAHPDIDQENGIYCTTGSLGHGLPIAVGTALGKKMKKEKGIIRVLLGDGECLEGTTFESLTIAEGLNLDNLEVYVDNNEYQAIDRTLYPAVDKLKKAFPELIVVDGKKGSPLSIFEKNPAHVYDLSEDTYKKLMEELK